MRHNGNKFWKKYRADIIKSDGGVCVRCGRGPSQGATLQVHHKEYLLGKLPWEYPPYLCETLCKGCHAEIHGKIRPSTGWVCVGEEDLGDLVGECELCGNAIRYVFLVDHPKWSSMEVGVVCCDHLTETILASQHMKMVNRRNNFVNPKKWIDDGNGTVSAVRHGIRLKIEPIESFFRISVNELIGKLRLDTIKEAKEHIFGQLEDGSLIAFLEKWGRR